MGDFEDSYLGRLRGLVGSRLVLMPGARCVLAAADGTVLMHRRGDSGLWSLPGGGAEEGQSLRQTVIREVAEETGYQIRDPIAWGHASDPEHELITYPNGDLVHAFALNFWVGRWSGEPRIDGRETLELGWFDPADLPPDTTPAHRRTLGFWLGYRRDRMFRVF